MENLCRMCARVSDSTLSLLHTQNRRLQWTVRKFNINLDRGAATAVCSDCYSEITQWIKFLKQSSETDASLRQRMYETNNHQTYENLPSTSNVQDSQSILTPVQPGTSNSQSENFNDNNASTSESEKYDSLKMSDYIEKYNLKELSVRIMRLSESEIENYSNKPNSVVVKEKILELSHESEYEPKKIKISVPKLSVEIVHTDKNTQIIAKIHAQIRGLQNELKKLNSSVVKLSRNDVDSYKNKQNSNIVENSQINEKLMVISELENDNKNIRNSVIKFSEKVEHTDETAQISELQNQHKKFSVSENDIYQDKTEQNSVKTEQINAETIELECIENSNSVTDEIIVDTAFKKIEKCLENMTVDEQISALENEIQNCWLINEIQSPQLEVINTENICEVKKLNFMNNIGLEVIPSPSTSQYNNMTQSYMKNISPNVNTLNCETTQNYIENMRLEFTPSPSSSQQSSSPNNIENIILELSTSPINYETMQNNMKNIRIESTPSPSSSRLSQNTMDVTCSEQELSLHQCDITQNNMENIRIESTPSPSSPRLSQNNMDITCPEQELSLQRDITQNNMENIRIESTPSPSSSRLSNVITQNIMDVTCSKQELSSQQNDTTQNNILLDLSLSQLNCETTQNNMKNVRIETTSSPSSSQHENTTENDIQNVRSKMISILTSRKHKHQQALSSENKREDVIEIIDVDDTTQHDSDCIDITDGDNEIEHEDTAKERKDLPRSKNPRKTKQIFKCKFCKFKTNIKNKILKHFKSKHLIITKQNLRQTRVGESKKLRNLKKYTCSKCNKMYAYEASYKLHLQRHKNAAVESLTAINHDTCKYLCDICGKLYTTKTILMTHIKRIHYQIKNYPCNECSKLFIFKHDLFIHASSSHPQYRPFKCYDCELSFKSKSTLQMHIKRVHNKIKPFSCDQCNKNFFWRSELRRHIAVHFRQHNKYQCELCKKRFKVKEMLVNHHLTKHKTMEPRKPMETLTCYLCDKNFKYRRSLVTHFTSIHINSSSFQCEICEKSFTYEYLLKRHQVTHSTAYNYSCDICHKRFKCEWYLKRHKSRVHSVN